MKFNVKRYFATLGICMAVILVGVFVYMGVDFSKAGKANSNTENTAGVVETDGGKINVLVMGVDVDGLRTDAMMLASYDTASNEVNLLSIPRDTRMFIGNRYQKINAAHAYIDSSGNIGGAEASIEAVNRLTGIPINYYIEFTFDGIAQLIDDLGPVTFTIPDLYGDGVGMVYDDPVQSLHINLPPGTYDLDGAQVVQLLRYRKGNKDPETGIQKGYANGDRDRISIQQDFLKALTDQKLNATLILKIPAMFQHLTDLIKTNLTVSDIIKYSQYLTNFTSAGIHAYSVPGIDSVDTNYHYDASYWLADLEAMAELTRNVFGYPADNLTIDSYLYPEAAEEDMENYPRIQNGSNIVEETGTGYKDNEHNEDITESENNEVDD